MANDYHIGQNGKYSHHEKIFWSVLPYTLQFQNKLRCLKNAIGEENNKNVEIKAVFWYYQMF